MIKTGNDFLLTSLRSKYSYNYKWLNRPIIQYPQDIVAIQELITDVEPDLIIECGVAHGGSIILSSSMLALLNMKERKKRKVLGVDIEIRPKNKKAIKKHYLNNYIQLIEKSSIENETIKIVSKISKISKKLWYF